MERSENGNKEQGFADKIQKVIETGAVKMRPKWHFAIRGALLVIGAILLALTLLFLVSLIFFVLRQSGAWYAPIFGLRGTYSLLLSLPWFLICAALVFIVILEILVQKYSFAYRKPLLYSAIAVIATAVVGGLVIAGTSFHGRLFEQARQDHLPVAGPLYRGYGGTLPENLIRGEIVKIEETQVHLETPEGEEVEINIGPQTRFPLGIDLAVGDNVLILGDRDGGTMTAFGIRRVEQGGQLPMPMQRMHMRFMPFPDMK